MAVVEQQLPGSFINLLHGWNALVVGVSLIVSDTLWLVIKGNEGDYWNFKNAREAGRRIACWFVPHPNKNIPDRRLISCRTDRKYVDHQDPRLNAQTEALSRIASYQLIVRESRSSLRVVPITKPSRT